MLILAGASGTTKNITAQYYEEIPPRFSSPSGEDKLTFVKYTFPVLSFQ
ncbi:hypothetical protein A628_01041 [Salmonella enterica subsp. enterica serovar Cubana str. 76814]|uniref:Uncharacterized protein n=1 Tax=Salmonella enterica subsp. enterica serovar Cubana str. 76814 TaxID=1192560 RepID=V7ISR4_SALET|nr:hypothetical protein A628_01041 [Salmonella enterica subsp. enterica serovar Cubana str. 76814]